MNKKEIRAARLARRSKARDTAQDFKSMSPDDKAAEREKYVYERKDSYSRAEQDAHRERTGRWKSVTKKPGESIKDRMRRSGRLTGPGDPGYGKQGGPEDYPKHFFRDFGHLID